MGWRGGDEDRKPEFVKGAWGEAETENLIMWLVMLDWLAGGWWWRETQSLI